MYPWGTAYPNRVPEDVANSDNDPNAAVIQSPSINNSFLCEEQPMQQLSQHTMGVDRLQSSVDQQAPLYTLSSTRSSYPASLDFDDQALEENLFMHNADGDLTSGMNWWNIRDNLFSAGNA